jgi:hypothetical protein
VTVGLVANAPTDILQVRYKLKTASAWVAANIAHKRTGSGNVTVSGLTNEALYTFSAYTLLTPAESEWLDPRECAPTAGGNGTYTAYAYAVFSKIAGSSALAAKVTDGLPAVHVKLGRYIHTDADAADALLEFGPVHYVMPAAGHWSPHSMDSSKGELAVAVTILETFDQSASADLLTHLRYIDALRKEILTGADGTGGSASWTPGGSVRINVEGPTVIARNTLATTLLISAMVPEEA